MDDKPTMHLGKEPMKLVKWPKAPTCAELKQNLTDASSHHQMHVQKIDTWLNNLRVEGNAKIAEKKGRSSVVPKLIRKHAEWRYPALSEPFLSTSDMFKVSPITWEDRGAANQNQILLNYQFNNCIDKVGFIDEYVRTGVDEGTIILKTGWLFEEREEEVEKPVVSFVEDEEFLPTLEQVMQLQDESPSDYMKQVPDELKQAVEMSIETGVAYRPEITGYEKVKELVMVRNQPTVEVCDYHNVIIDPTAQGVISKAGFVIHKIETNMDTLERDGRYKNLDHILIDSANILSEPDFSVGGEGHSFNFQDKARKKFVMYEYWGFWDIDGSGITKPIVAAWVGGTIIRMEENPFPDGELPFVLVPYLPVRKSNYGEPDGALLEDNQKITGAVTRGMLDILGRSANAQTGIRKDFLDFTNKKKFMRGEDYEYNVQADPLSSVFMHTYTEIPNSAQLILQQQAMEAESLTGVKSFGQGVNAGSLGDVAAAVRGALDASSKRETAILRRLASGIVEVGRKFISMNSLFLSEEEVVRVTNDEFVQINRDDLQGKFDLALSITTAEEDNLKAQELAFMLQTMGNNMDFNMTKLVLVEIAKLRKMPDLAKQIETFEPKPDPMQEQLAQMQMMKLQAEIEEIQARTAQLASTAQLNQAKTGTEVVKQQDIQADIDQKDLDWVEQESGVKQEREKELHGEQARAQSQMELLKQGAQSRMHDEKIQADLLKEYIKAAKSK